MKETVLNLLKSVLDKYLVILWAKFKAKNAKVATAIAAIIGTVLLVINANINNPEIAALLGPSLTSTITWVINIIGFLWTSVNGASTYNDLQKIEKQNDTDTKQ